MPNIKTIVSSLKKTNSPYTEFQRKVWIACASIPKGETRTYAWVAKKIGQPKAVRAVGSALGKNPFAPIIPCHRVLRADGGWGGYSGKGGIKTKASLLKKEGFFTQP